MFADYTLHNKLTKIMAESFLPRDIIKDFSRHYKNNKFTEHDPRIARLVKKLDEAIEEWSSPVGGPLIASVQLTEIEKNHIKDGEIISAIRWVKNRTGYSLKDSKIIVDNYRFR